MSSQTVAAAAAASAAAAISSNGMVALAHDEARMLFAAGLHVLSRAFEHLAAAGAQSSPQDWECALAVWASRLPLASVGGSSSREQVQLLAAIKIIHGRCKPWLEKGGRAGKLEVPGSSGKDSSSSSSASVSTCADMTAMD
jgi:hypothetical protein